MCKKIPLGAARLHQAHSYYSISKPKPFSLLRDWWSPESLSFHGEVLHGADKGPSMAVEHGVLMHLTALGPLSHLAAGGVVWEPHTPPVYLCSHHRWWVTDSQGILTWSAEAIEVLCCVPQWCSALFSCITVLHSCPPEIFGHLDGPDHSLLWRPSRRGFLVFEEFFS